MYLEIITKVVCLVSNFFKQRITIKCKIKKYTMKINKSLQLMV